jgi:hypothetical protein
MTAARQVLCRVLLGATFCALFFTVRVALGQDHGQATWAPFSVRVPNTLAFEEWLDRAHPKDPLPPFRNTLSLNCWEFVLYSKLKDGSATLDAAQNVLSARRNGQSLVTALGQHVGTASYTITTTRGSEKGNFARPLVTIEWPPGVQSGDIVLMDGPSHVAQLTAHRDNHGRPIVVSFSPRPIWGDGSWEVPVPNTQPESTTVNSLIEELIDLYPDVPTDWQNIRIDVVRWHPSHTNPEGLGWQL